MKMLCTCGNMLSNQSFPNPNVYTIISEEDLDRLDEPINSDSLFRESSLMFRCDKCGRLWVYWKDDGNPSEYLPAS